MQIIEVAMKKILIVVLVLLTVNCTARIIFKNSKQEIDIQNVKPNYTKRSVSQFIGFRSYSLPVTPNEPQKFKSTWFTSKDDLAKHTTPVCNSGVSAIMIRRDFWDFFQHFFIGGINSTRSIDVFCS